jgi:hypothetical protein
MRHHAFALDHLEGRAMFSVAAPLDAAPVNTTAASIIVPHLNTATPLVGEFNVAGTYAKPVGPIGNPDTGNKYQFTGAGKKKSLGGNFTLAGDVTAPGFVQNGRSTGYLTITTDRGTIVLKVQGPPQDPGVLPPSLFYRIVSGTGKYAHAAGKGHIALSASSTTHKFLFRFNPPA